MTSPGSSSTSSTRFTSRGRQTAGAPHAARRRRRNVRRALAGCETAGDREMHGEGAALAAGALDRHSPAVRRDDPLDQAQPEPSALHLRGDDVGGAIERLEDARLICRVDPDAAVGDGDADLRRRTVCR